MHSTSTENNGKYFILHMSDGVTSISFDVLSFLFIRIFLRYISLIVLIFCKPTLLPST
jgi:hypothetical protein